MAVSPSLGLCRLAEVFGLYLLYGVAFESGMQGWRSAAPVLAGGQLEVVAVSVSSVERWKISSQLPSLARSALWRSFDAPGFLLQEPCERGQGRREKRRKPWGQLKGSCTQSLAPGGGCEVPSSK